MRNKPVILDLSGFKNLKGLVGNCQKPKWPDFVHLLHNATDSALIIDAMDLLSTLVTHESLIQKARELGLFLLTQQGVGIMFKITINTHYKI